MKTKYAPGASASARSAVVSPSSPLLVAVLCLLGCSGSESAVTSVLARSTPASSPSVAPPTATLVAAAAMGSETLALRRDDQGVGTLWLEDEKGTTRSVPCDRLVGAWGLWVDDVDRDGHPEALVALRKTARFDARVDNRLHVYGFEDGRCVPAWRGTRLAGRFDALAIDPLEPGAIIVSERLGPALRRVARYRWSGFGYAVADVIWEGSGDAPPELVRDLLFAPEEAS